MISPERLRRYPHFAGVSEEGLKEVAMISEEREFQAGQVLFNEGDPAEYLMILERGQVDIRYELGDGSQVTVDTLVGGDLMGWSALLDPYMLTASGVAKTSGRLIAVRAEPLRELCDENPAFGYRIMERVAQTLRSRLRGTRIQLVAQA